MTPSLRSAGAAHDTTMSTLSLESRLRGLIGEHFRIDADQLVGYVYRIRDLAGEPDVPPIRVRAWLGPARRHARLGRSFHLDPYSLQVLIDDTRRAGRGTRLDLVVSRSTPAFALAALRKRLAALAQRGIDVRLRVERRRRDYSFLFAP